MSVLDWLTLASFVFLTNLVCFAAGAACENLRLRRRERRTLHLFALRVNRLIEDAERQTRRRGEPSTN